MFDTCILIYHVIKNYFIIKNTVIKHFLISGNYLFNTSKNTKTVPHNFIYLPISWENGFFDSIKSNFDNRNFCLDQNTLIARRTL